MYDHNYCLLVWAWKLFKNYIELYHQQFQTQTSLIETFATFILLSSAKLLVTCIDLLFSFTTAYDKKGEVIKTKFFYSMMQLSNISAQSTCLMHCSLSIGFIFIILPFFLLLLYPYSNFQKILNLRCQTLHIFMDAFRGIYRVEPHDMRYFAAYYFVQHMLFFFLVTRFTSALCVLMAALILLSSAAAVIVFQPYKKQAYNLFDTFFLVVSATCYLAFFGLFMTSRIDHYHFHHIEYVLIINLAVFFAAYLLALLWGIPCTCKLWTKAIATLTNSNFIISSSSR